ncbi:hypothetical protein P3T76_012484 [Phytophthora citrophthora]|uniref:Uncharacterized protein n=1 Tax=Phytophthora citrophthora TaxID=4793 RepID=A0AAD9G4N1_9STRA|nr:hypothetical protein P3T76_012484 [Phytophthora citrophthora]
MEKMLVEHEPPLLLSIAKAKLQSPESQTILKPGSDDIFPKWDGASRIEEMWQNLTLKPLNKNLTENVTDSSRRTQGYNSISLRQELTKGAETSDNNEENDNEAKLHNEMHQENDTAHRIHVQHCRRVFEDEIYRECLVNDALGVLRSGKAPVCFVVPSLFNPEQKRTDEEDELVEMALRSLYLDVKQSIASSPDGFPNISLSSWSMRPKVHHETSGYITVKLSPA